MTETCELMSATPASDTPRTSRCMGTVDLAVSCFHSDGRTGGEVNVDLKNAVLFSDGMAADMDVSEGPKRTVKSLGK